MNDTKSKIKPNESISNDLQSVDESKTFLRLSISKSSWVLPLILSYGYSHLPFKEINAVHPLFSTIITLMVLCLFGLGLVYSIKGIKFHRKYNDTSIRNQSIIGLILNFLFLLFITAAFITGYMSSLNG